LINFSSQPGRPQKLWNSTTSCYLFQQKQHGKSDDDAVANTNCVVKADC